MRLIKKYFDGNIIQHADATKVNIPIITNIPLDDSLESKFYRDLALLSATTDEERKAEDFYNRATNQGVYQHTVEPTNIRARTGHIQVDPKTGDVVEYTAPTTVSAAPLTEGQRMWRSPAFQLALSIPTIDLPFIFKGLSPKTLPKEASLVESPQFLRISNNSPKITNSQTATAHYDVDDVTQQLIDYTKLHDYKAVDLDWIKNAANKIMSENNSGFSRFDINTFKNNYSPELIDDFARNTYYHDAFTSADDIMREFAKMGRPEEEVLIDKDLIGQFYSKDVFPRTIANLKERGINLKPEEIEELSRIYAFPWEGVDMKYGYTKPGTVGYSRGSNFIRYQFDEEVPFHNVGHELHHSIRRRLAKYLKDKGYNVADPSDISRSQASSNPRRFVTQTNLPEYTPGELKAMDKYRFSLPDRRSLTPTSEQGATLAELRLKYFEQYLNELKLKNKAFNTSEFDQWLLNNRAEQALRDLSETSYGISFGKRFNDITDRVLNHYYNTNTYPKWLPKSRVKSIEALKNLNGYNYAYWRSSLANALAENLGRQILIDASKVAGYSIPIGLGSILSQDEDSFVK